MKNSIVWIPAVFVLGGLVGRFGPQEELRAYRKTADADASARIAPSANGFDSFAALANIPTAASRPRLAEPSRASAATNDASASTGDASAVGAAEADDADAPSNANERPKRLDPEDLRARIDEAAELWRMRISLKRATTIEKLGLDEKGASAFDDALAVMNERLRDAMQSMADQLAPEGAEMTPELGVRLLGDMSIAIAEAYDSMGAVVDEGKRGEVSRLQLFEFVDPSAAEPLISVQDRLSAAADRERRRK